MAAQVPTAVAELFSLHGKCAIATGGTGGLGLAMAVALAEAGADIVSIELPDDPNSGNLESKVKGLGRSFKAYQCNVKDSKELRKTFENIWSDGIKGDILLNCAGIQRRAAAEEMDDDTIDDVFAINLKATFVGCQEMARHLMSEGRGGKMINVGSVCSFISGTNISPYIATKGGVMQATKAFSSEWASKGIQVNAICPGYFKTALTTQYSEDPKYKGFNEYVLSRTPAGRWGDPSDLRGAVIFLASRASDYVSGTSIVVDGGMIGK